MFITQDSIAMSTLLKEYIEKRLKDSKAVSLVECDLLATIDRYHLSGHVKVIYIEESRYEVYLADVNANASPVRIKISSEVIEGNHQLKNVLGGNPETRRQRDSLFSYDPSIDRLLFDDYFKWFDGLESVFNTVDSFLTAAGIQLDDNIIIGKTIYTEKAFLYILEQKTAGVMHSAYNGEELSTLRRIEIDNSVSQAKIGVTFPMNTVLGLMLNRKDIYVPIDDITLDSEFCNGVSWRRLLGGLAEESEKDVAINGMRCRLLRLTPYVDGFGDVFIDVWSPLDRRLRHVLVLGPGYDMKFGCDTISSEQLQFASEVNSRSQLDELPQNEPEASPMNQSEEFFQSQPESDAQSQPEVTLKSQQKEKPQGGHKKKPDSHSKKPDGKKLDKPDSKNYGKYHQEPLLSEDSMVLLDGSEFQWKKINEQIPSMSLKEIDRTFTIIDNVFKTLASSERIVTDTNLWVTEFSTRPREMAFGEIIDHLRRRKDRNKEMVFELISEVYDEIDKLDKRNTAAAHKAKNMILSYQKLDLLETPNLKLKIDAKAYADEPIGHRVLQLYEDGVKFSILTNDTDASIRWRSGLKEKQRDLNRHSLPHMILCRELHTLFRMRGKLIARRRQLDSNKK